MAAISAALSEATGGMGSLRDRFLSADNGDDIGHDDVGPASQRLGFLVKQIERRARAAAAALGIELVLHDRFPTRRDAASGP
jgi:hypothetical protein